MIRLFRPPRAFGHCFEEQRLLPTPSLHGQASFEDSEGMMGQKQGHAAHATIRLSKLRRCIAIVGIAILVLLLTAAYRSKSQPQLASDKTGRRNAQILHLVIPTSDLDPELCRTVLSAEILHYPTPTLVRWTAVAGEGLANAQRRTTAIRDYLGKLKGHHENGTVILLDTVSTWFQLRPEVLLSSYYGVIHDGNQQLAARLGVEVMQEEGIQQSIVFATSSTCGAAEEQCSQPPESLMVDKASWTTAPHYLDQGVAIGRVRDLFETYRRAVAIIERTEDLHLSELAIFTEIFSKQEYHRGLLRSSTSSWSERFHGWLSGSYAHGPLARKNATGPRHKNNANEFGIGLDYAGELAFDTASNSGTYTWERHATIPRDILSSMPPFWMTTDSQLSAEKTWSDLSFLTNSHTQAIPVAVYHHHNNVTDANAHQESWQNFWLSQHSRKLFDAYTSVPAMPLAAVIDHENVDQIFWDTTIGEKAGVKWSNETWVGWNELCRGEQLANEIFGDGLGEWTSPAL